MVLSEAEESELSLRAFAGSRGLNPQTGTDRLLTTLADTALDSLRSRFSYAVQLRPFSLEDTTDYIRYHLTGAGQTEALLSDAAVRAVFQASRGAPRNVNQLVLQALIQATVEGRDDIDGRFMSARIAAHPLYRRGEP